MVNEQTVLSMIRSAFVLTPPITSLSFSVTDYLSFAKSQQLEVLLITGMRKLGIPYTPEMRQIVLRLAMVSNLQTNVAEKLYALFESHQVDYMPLKGCELKSLYPSAEMRSMGDIDVLIRKEKYKKYIRPMLLAEGFKECYESDHEYVWDKDGVHIELHKRLIPSYNKDYYAYYGDGWQLAKPTDKPYRYAMSHEDTFVFIFTHYAKHYRDVGAGIRQVLDLYVYRKAYPQMDESYIQQTLTQLQLERFYANTMHMLDVWFGDAEHTEASQLISDHLFASGAFGTRENSLQSTMLKQVNHQGSVEKARLAKWLHRIFLPLDSMRRLYPILHKFPFLLPFLWIPRWIRILLHKRYRFEEYRQEDSALDEATVESYREGLQKAGLDFNFK